MGNMKGDRPHNPLVPGSSPSCTIFSTHTSEWFFISLSRFGSISLQSHQFSIEDYQNRQKQTP